MHRIRQRRRLDSSKGCLQFLSAINVLVLPGIISYTKIAIVVNAFSTQCSVGFRSLTSPQSYASQPITTTLLKALSVDKDASLDASTGEEKPSRNYPNKTTHQSTMERNEDYEFWGDSLSVASFNMDLENLSEEDPQKSADFLDIMEAKYKEEPTNPFCVKPNAACYTTVIDGWTRFQGSSSSSSTSNNHHRYGAQQALKWLERLEKAYDNSNDEELKPNTLSYILVCQKWADDYAEDFQGESIEMAEKVLLKMTTRLNNNSTTGDEDDEFKVWSIVLDGWCKRAGKLNGAMQRAEQLLTNMEDKFSTSNADDSEYNKGGPNIVTYTNFIGGLARSREGRGAEKAEEILQRMKARGIEPDMVSFTALLNCYAKSLCRSEQKRAARRALEILDFMESQYIDEEKFFLKPNVITYSTAIKAIGQSLDRDSSNLAEKVLKRMYTLHETGKISTVKPQTSTFNAVISAFANHSRRIMRNRNSHIPPSKTQRTIGLKNARRAEQLLVEMTQRSQAGEADVEPNVRTWASIISAWAESGQVDAGDQAQRVLHAMQELYDKGASTAKPNFVCYTSVMAAMGSSAIVSNDVEAVSKSIKTADKVEEILKRMEDDYEASLDIEQRPNTITYITAIDAVMKLDPQNAAPRAQRTVDRMVRLYAKGLGHVRPSRILFNSLINAWSRCPKGPVAAQKAEEIFLWMEKQYRESGDNIVKPDEVSLCGVLNAWANNAGQGGARRAQQILDKIESMPAKDRQIEHSTVAYNIAIKAWGRSKDPEAVQRAEAILQWLETNWERNHEEILKPDVTTYSSVINCCAYYMAGRAHDHDMTETSDQVLSGRNEAFQVALRTFRKLCESKTASPNNITYGTLLKAIAFLTPINEDREILVRKIWQQCCQAGEVDTFVLSQVRNACSSSLYRELVLEPAGSKEGGGKESFSFLLKQLPAQWCKYAT